MRECGTLSVVDNLDTLFAAWGTREIADALGMGEVSVRRWRLGHRKPRAARIRALGAVLARLRAHPAEPTNEAVYQACQDVHAAVAADAAARRRT